MRSTNIGQGAFDSPVFILGTERSGSTWLANIFDAAPSTVLFMEPFCVPVGMFADFPEPSFFIDGTSSTLTGFLRSEMPRRLLRNKTFLLENSFSTPRVFAVDRAFAEAAKLSRIRKAQKKARKFQHLNLNRFDPRARSYPKNDPIEQVVIKELRLAGKIPLLKRAFPTARFVLIVRHPGATVNSILRWFRKGRLAELQNSMVTYLDKIAAQLIGLEYGQEIVACRRGSLAHTVALYWRVSYETMYNKLAGHDGLFVIAYEELASNPVETTKHLFAGLHIPWSPTVEDYVLYSSGDTPPNLGAVTTVRRSRTYYREWESEISDTTSKAVSEIAGESFLIPMFETYYT